MTNARRILIAAIFSTLGYAQGISPSLPPPVPDQPLVEVPDEDTVIRASVEMVNIAATVRGRRDAVVTNLEVGDFRLLEDGKPQQIRAFSRDTNLPLSVALMIDASSSMEQYFRAEAQAAKLFFERVLRPDDRAMVAGFRTQTELFQDMTGELNLLERGLQRLMQPLQPVIGTVLYDALVLASDKRLASRSGRKVMVVLSDWADYGSRHTLEDALESAEKADVIVYAIAFPAGMFAGEANNALNAMTKKTGGRIFRVNKGEDLEKIFEQIEEEVRTQYLFSYTPTNTAHDGKYRKIELKTPKGDYKVQTREGYYAPAE